MEQSKDSSRMDILLEHLKLMGLATAVSEGRIRVLSSHGLHTSQVDGLRASTRVDIIIQPSQAIAESIGLKLNRTITPSERLASAKHPRFRRLRSLSPAQSYLGGEWHPVLATSSGEAVWLARRESPNRSTIVLGTAITDDLELFRQGDPEQPSRTVERSAWGFPNERPNYLFNTVIEAGRRNDRQVDFIMETLSLEIAELLDETRSPILPGNAPGALVVTGDDDQAEIAMYETQLKLLSQVPITYFLHPLTRLDHSTIQRFKTSHGCLEFALHPDALDTPHNYPLLLSQQSAWFTELVGEHPRYLRNHGYLNQGYWGHLEAWQESGFVASSNIPGLDGEIVTNSLLPMRLSISGQLTDHWSIVTLFGDGMVSALGMSDDSSANLFLSACDDLRSSGVPGVIVINVHPQNINLNRKLHGAIREISRSDFVSWTFSEMISWFQHKTVGESIHDGALTGSSLDKFAGWSRRMLRRFGVP